MLVVLANHIPPAVRGRMKLWFIEPRPNIFVSGIKDHLAEEVVSYLYEHCPVSAGLLIIKKINTAPGYMVSSMGGIDRQVCEISGLQLIMEKSFEKDIVNLPKTT